MAILIIVNAVVLTAHADTSKELEAHRVMVVEEKNQSQSAYERVSELSEQKTSLSSSLKKETVKSKKLERENQTLKANLQAKKERQELESKKALAEAAVEEPKETYQSAPTVTVSGDKASWLAASGIPKSDWGYVDMIVSRESGWDPCAFNPGLSDCNANPASACGLAQSLPCGKQSKYGHWTDPVANLKWQHEYVKGRYGGYAGAVAFWNANHWY